MTAAEYIAWAASICPEPVAGIRAPFDRVWAEYDAVDARVGDDAEGDDFWSRVLWLEVTFRVRRHGWTVEEVEAQRWPVQSTARIGDLLRDLAV